MGNNVFNQSIMANIKGNYARWYKPTAVDHEQILNLSRILNVSEQLSSLLIRRTNGCIASAVDLWSGQYDLPEVFELPGINSAVKRLIAAIKSREHVLIYSDFDADGVTSAVILKEALEFAKTHKVSVFLPCRFKDGYGFHSNLIHNFHEQGIDLIVTADCGIADLDACNKAKSLGIDVIITDHHKAGSHLPQALSVINPHLTSWRRFALQNLSGAGVAYLLAIALLEKKGLLDDIPSDWALDMLTLSIAGDSMPVGGINRAWVKQGLQAMYKSRRPGILAMLCVLDVFKLKSNHQESSDDFHRQPLNYEKDIAYGLVPRINAAGRLSHAYEAFQLLCETNLQKAFAGAHHLDDLNRKRRRIEQTMLEECYEKLESFAQMHSDNKFERYSVCLYDPAWHEGVVGITASRIRDLLWRPCAMVAGEGPVLKGSVRSIPGLDIHRALSKCKHLLETFGGHAAAGGFSVKVENLPAFIQEFESVTENLMKNTPMESSIQIDESFDSKKCHQKLFEPYILLEPFGKGNPRPVVSILGCRITGVRLLGKSQDHLELTVQGAHRPVRLIWFRAGEKVGQICLPGKCDLAFTPNQNMYMDKEQISLFVEDARLPRNLIGRNYRKLVQYVSDDKLSILYTWSSDAAYSIYVSLLRQGVNASLHLKGQKGALAHNAKLAINQNRGTIVSTSPWDLFSQGLKREVDLLVVHPPICSSSWEELLKFSALCGMRQILPGTFLNDSKTWLFASFPSKENIEQVWKSFVTRAINDRVPVWQAGPLYLKGFSQFPGVNYEHLLVLLESCISILMELGMISYEVFNRIPWLKLHKPVGQVSLSRSVLYIKGRRNLEIAEDLMERFKGGIKHGGKR